MLFRSNGPQCSEAALIYFQSLCSLCPPFHDQSETVVPGRACDNHVSNIEILTSISLHFSFCIILLPNDLSLSKGSHCFVGYFSFQLIDLHKDISHFGGRFADAMEGAIKRSSKAIQFRKMANFQFRKLQYNISQGRTI